jgi:hypothetical protein
MSAPGEKRQKKKGGKAAEAAAAAATDGATDAAPAVKNHNKYRKDKPWDHDGIDHWKVEVRAAQHGA